jgi:hypothetical protein
VEARLLSDQTPAARTKRRTGQFAVAAAALCVAIAAGTGLHAPKESTVVDAREMRWLAEVDASDVSIDDPGGAHMERVWSRLNLDGVR